MNELKIYTIMMMRRLEKNTKGGRKPIFGGTRIVGYYENYEDAYISVTGNSCDIHQGIYQYALIEEVKEGLLNPAKSEDRHWFEYSEKTDRYIEIKEPDFCNNFNGITIG